MHVPVKILEDQETGPVFQVECLVRILLSLVVDVKQDQMVEEAAEARKARKVEGVVRSEWVVVEGRPRGSP